MGVIRFDPILELEGITATVACTEGDLLTLNSSGNSLLADSTDATKLALGVASRTVSAADITAGGDRAKCSIYPRAIVDGFTSLTPAARRYLKASSSAGSTDTTTRPSSAGNAIQAVGVAISITKVLYDCRPSVEVVQATGNSTVAFG